jgi:EmrB/QacA subfamily drug resistance transporter
MTSHSREPHSPDQSAIRVLLTASLVCSMIMLDSNIVAVSLPAIARCLGATFADIEWVVSAYVLSFSALLLAAGSYADRHGRKHTILIGLALFAVASGICGFATGAVVLNLARALQGVGASLLLTAALAVIDQAFTGAERAKAYAFWGACIGVAITAGPIVGGIITSLAGWRWAFLINLPLCIGLLGLSVTVLPESADQEAKRLDYGGIVTFSAGLFLLIWALIGGNAAGWASGSTLVRFTGAGVLLIAFIFVELRQDRPMVDLALFTQPNFLGAAFAMLGYAGGAQVLIFLLPMYLQNFYGYDPARAGLGMIPFALPMFLTPRLGAKVGARHSGRMMLSLGLAATLAGDLLLCGIAAAGMTYWTFAFGMLVAGIGAGLLNSETTKAMQGAVPVQRAGMASGLTSTTRFTGLLVAVAGLGAVLSYTVSRQFTGTAVTLGLDRTLASTLARSVASGDLAGVTSAIPMIIRPQVHLAARVAFSDGFAAAFLVAAGVALVTGLLTFLLLRSRQTSHADGPAMPIME